MRSLDARLLRLEGASAAGRTVLIWEPDGEYDLDELKRRHDVGPDDRVFLFRWARRSTE
jgi:hypothetical protein